MQSAYWSQAGIQPVLKRRNSALNGLLNHLKESCTILIMGYAKKMYHWTLAEVALTTAHAQSDLI